MIVLRDSLNCVSYYFTKYTAYICFQFGHQRISKLFFLLMVQYFTYLNIKYLKITKSVTIILFKTIYYFKNIFLKYFLDIVTVLSYFTIFFSVFFFHKCLKEYYTMYKNDFKIIVLESKNTFHAFFYTYYINLVAYSLVKSFKQLFNNF